jgi:iron complex outermembrane receptor protein
VPKAASKEEAIYEESVVTASRGGAQSPLESPSAITIITEQDIRLSGITKIPNLLRRIVSVDMIEGTGAHNDVSFRGFNQRLSNKVIVLIDGRSVFIDWFGGTFWETLSIDVDQIERIEVIRGPGSALYGADAMTGVINIITKAPGTGGNKARIGMGDNLEAYGSLRATGRDKDFAYRASAGYTRRPRWSREVTPNRVDLQTNARDQNLGSEAIRFDLRTTKQIGRDATIGLGGGFNQGFLDFYTIGAFKDYNATYRTGDVTAFLNTKKFNLRAFYNFSRFNPISFNHNYVGQNLYRADVNTNVVDVEGVFADKFDTGSIGHAVNLGANYRLRNADSAYTQGNIDEHHYGFFAQETATFSKAVQLVLGGRLDYVPYTKRFEPSPRGSLLIHPSEKQTIRATVSSAFRKPTFLEGYLDLGIQVPTGSVHSQQDTQRMNQLRPERILSAEIGYLNQESDKFDIEVAAYYNRVTDLITLQPNQFLTPSQRLEGVGFDPATNRYIIGFGSFANQCNVFNVVGGELGVRTYPVQGLDIFANYALNHSMVDKPEGCEIPSDRRTSSHKLNVGVQVRSKPGIDGEVLLHFVSNQRWVERDFDNQVQAVVFKQAILPAYTLLNARIGYRFLANRAEISATAFNLLNNVHQEHPFTNFVGRRFMGFFQYTF